jgi:hypothetical protein
MMNPAIWANRDTVSNMGKMEVPQVFIKIVMSRKASMIRV